MDRNGSIIFRSGLTMGSIALLARPSMIGSVLIAESSKGAAAAINLAGSLIEGTVKVHVKHLLRNLDSRV